MVDAEKIRAEGVKLLEEFSEKLKDVPDTKETHYAIDLSNVWRPDGQPIRHEGFRARMAGNAPRMEDGYFACEKGA